MTQSLEVIVFERYTAGARLVVMGAQEEARRLGHGHIGSEHLLLALAAGEQGEPAAATLAEFGLDPGSVEAQLGRIAGREPLDASALQSVGIDLDEVRRRVEAQFGPGSLDETVPPPRGRWLRRSSRLGGAGGMPFSDDAKQTLELALREAITLRDREIGAGHLLLGLLRSASGLGWRIVQIAVPEPSRLRTRLVQRMRASA